MFFVSGLGYDRCTQVDFIQEVQLAALLLEVLPCGLINLSEQLLYLSDVGGRRGQVHIDLIIIL